jgi:hypothetical protein
MPPAIPSARAIHTSVGVQNAKWIEVDAAPRVRRRA